MQVSTDPAVPLQSVIWYDAPPGAQVLGVPTAFCSSNWDYDPLSGPGVLGERRYGPRTYYLGQNTWNTVARCHVGSDAQFANGISLADWQAPAPALPLCCQAPFNRRWYLRDDLPIVQKAGPPVKLALWDEPLTAPTYNLLSPDFGNLNYQISAPGIVLPAAFGYRIWAKSYLTAPLPQQIIPAGAWQIGLSGTCLFNGGALFTMKAGVLQLDQQNHLVNTILFDGDAGFVPMFGGGQHTSIINWTQPEIAIGPGDCLCLEMGFIARGFRLPYMQFYGNAYTSGNTQFDTNHVPITFPAAFLQAPTIGGSLLLETGEFLLLETGGKITLE